ncbi:hypothetical protein DK419_21230 [Methylobacterium terrae]|uniref:RES domain-containing protein n=1 Tax=Methylobacterium terrae TaxID=2202827 RepID=A0A2U8WRA4_9HYPH|nr:hypothetical protein DK419_21230 [Methylobacterium terrae]
MAATSRSTTARSGASGRRCGFRPESPVERHGPACTRLLVPVQIWTRSGTPRPAEDYAASQRFGEAVRASGGHGILYDSLRHAGGANAVAYRPRGVLEVAQGDHYAITVRAAAPRIAARRLAGSRVFRGTRTVRCSRGARVLVSRLPFPGSLPLTLQSSGKGGGA